jgi:hypothetical protein
MASTYDGSRSNKYLQVLMSIHNLQIWVVQVLMHYGSVGHTKTTHETSLTRAWGLQVLLMHNNDNRS